MNKVERNEQMVQYYKSRNQEQDTLTYPVKFEQEKDGSWVAVARGLSALGVYSFLTNGKTLEEVRKFAGYELYHLSALLGPVGELIAGEELVKVVEEPNQKVEELEAELDKLQQEQYKRQKETDSLVLELRQQVERYRNANARAISAEMKLAEFVRQGVLKMTPNGHEPVLTREHIDETVFMCKIRANRMAEALHKYKYQKKNAYASEKDREDAETDYMNALQLFNDTFAYL